MTEVTIMLPVYNGMPYLPEAIDSILHQTLKDFKFVIINDGSTDGTKCYLDKITDPRVKIFHRSNHGLGATLNFGLEMCHTEFLARMDADDISYPERLQKQLDYLRKNEDVGAVGTQIEYFSSSNGRRGYGPTLYCEHNDIYEALLRLEHNFCHPSLMFRVTTLRKICGYRLEGIGEDWDMFLRLGEVSKLANLGETLYGMRLHSDSVTWSNWRECRRNNLYSSQCAHLRRNDLPEISYKDFIKKYESRSVWQRIAEELDTISLIQYRMAILEKLNGNELKGRIRLAGAALCSPSRVIARMKRMMK